MAEKPTIDDLKDPLLAAVGAADLALERVNDIVATLRDRAGDARTDANSRVDESRARLTKARKDLSKFQDDLPDKFEELRDKLTADELRSLAERYADNATEAYNKLVDRGEAALEKLRKQNVFEDARERAEDARAKVEEQIEKGADRAREIGERAAKLVGVELPKKEKAAKKAPAKKAAAKKAAPAKKAPAKKAPTGTVTQK
jgi:heparin binding hemagglutinin HbhA